MRHAAQGVFACLASVALCQGQGIITTVAGSDLVYPGSSFSGLSASFGLLSGVAVSPVTGNVYFASSSRSLILSFNPKLNSVTVVAGIGIGGYSGDGGPAAGAALNTPHQINFDRAGNLYIADTINNAIRKIDTTGVISTFASNLGGPSGLAFAPDGTLYVSTYTRILHVAQDGTDTVVAGGQQPGYSGDGGPAINASLNSPQSIVFDSAGNLLFADYGNSRIRRITASGTISTIAGNGQLANPVAGPALNSPLHFVSSLAVDTSGNIYIGDYGDLLKVALNGTLSILAAGSGNFALAGPLAIANANVAPLEMAFDQTGNLYFTDGAAYCLYRLSAAGSVQAVAGYAPIFGKGDNGPAVAAGLDGPAMLGLLPDGSLLIAEQYGERIRRLAPNGVIKPWRETVLRAFSLLFNSVPNKLWAMRPVTSS